MAITGSGSRAARASASAAPSQTTTLLPLTSPIVHTAILALPNLGFVDAIPL